jgi:hypothetical protein
MTIQLLRSKFSRKSFRLRRRLRHPARVRATAVNSAMGGTARWARAARWARQRDGQQRDGQQRDGSNVMAEQRDTRISVTAVNRRAVTAINRQSQTCLVRGRRFWSKLPRNQSPRKARINFTHRTAREIPGLHADRRTCRGLAKN